jgi:hypothetical protein
VPLLPPQKAREKEPVVARRKQCHRQARTVPRALLVFLVLFPSSVAPAQTDRSSEDIDSPGLVIEAAAGWDGTVDLSTPVPISFLIRNDSDRIIEGDLRLSDPLRGHEVSLGEVVVAPGTARRVASIQAMTDWFECIATLSDGTQVLWRRELPLQTANEFTENVNFALFIDDGGRRLELPGSVSPTTALAAAQLPVAGEKGRPLRCLTAKTWQLPNHPGPLMAIKALIFPEGAAEDPLNAAQWEAVAEWMCQGGVVFVHGQSAGIIDRLTSSAPLDADPAGPSGGFVVRRVGLGALYEYAEPLLPSAGHEVRQRIGETIARLTQNRIGSLLDSANWYYRRGGRADLNRILVVVFFGFYTFLSGVVALLLFRLSQRRMGAYLVGVVVGASILSGLLGGYLRFSQGDLHWTTVTQVGAGGAVQVGRIEVQSAGGRNTHVAIQGEHADLQFVGADPRYNPWYRPQTGYPPFTWQPNLAPGTDDTYRVNVTMTPWGRRRLRATAFQRAMRPLDFKLEFEPRESPQKSAGESAQPFDIPSGVFKLKLVNHLPFELVNCWLVIGVTCPASEQATATQPPAYAPYRMGGPSPPASTPVDGLIDVYQQRPVQHVAAGAAHADTFDAEFQVLRNNWDQMLHLPGGSLSPPRIARLGAASAWIVAHIEDSPIMTIDQPRSDFVPREHLHLFVQEILPEDMPDASLFLGTAAGAASGEEEHGTP